MCGSLKTFGSMRAFWTAVVEIGRDDELELDEALSVDRFLLCENAAGTIGVEGELGRVRRRRA
jgi:hypothetical protein